LPPWVQHIDLRVADRLANRNASLPDNLLPDGIRCREHGRLRRPVAVDYPVLAQIIKGLRNMLDGCRLPAKKQLPHMLKALQMIIDHRIEQRCGHKSGSHALLVHNPGELGGIQQIVPRYQHQRRSVEQCPENFIGGSVKGVIRQLQHPVFPRQIRKAIVHARLYNVAMAGKNPLRLPRGTGSIHNISNIIRAGAGGKLAFFR